MRIWINIYKSSGNYVGVNGYKTEQSAVEHESKGCIAVAVPVEYEEVSDEG